MTSVRRYQRLLLALPQLSKPLKSKHEYAVVGHWLLKLLLLSTVIADRQIVRNNHYSPHLVVTSMSSEHPPPRKATENVGQHGFNF